MLLQWRNGPETRALTYNRFTDPIYWYDCVRSDDFGTSKWYDDRCSAKHYAVVETMASTLFYNVRTAIAQSLTHFAVWTESMKPYVEEVKVPAAMLKVFQPDVLRMLSAEALARKMETM